MSILAVNAGSSTLKVAQYVSDGVHRYHVKFDQDIITVKFRGLVKVLSVSELDKDRCYQKAFEFILGELLDDVTAVTHRVVHGGDKFADHQIIDDEVLAQLEQLIPFAPLHQPFNLKLLKLSQKLLPEIPQIACFDTQFHRSIPDVATQYAIPQEYFEAGQKVYGFHGLSYEYVSQFFAQSYPEYAGDRLLIAHIGSGASLCGVKNQQAIATSMGFSTLEGLPMSTRCGQIDAGLLLYWLAQGDDIASIENRLYKQSGLLGLSGISSDFQALRQSSAPQAKKALAVWLYRVNQQIGAMVAAMGGVDHIIFTAGVGENESGFRAQLVDLLKQWLPTSIDVNANQNNEQCISRIDSAVKLWVIATNEEQVMVNHAKRLLN